MKHVLLPKSGHFAHFTHRSIMTRRGVANRFRHPGGVPATALPVDSTGGARVLCPMDGNDSLGDCGEAMICHVDNIFTFGRGQAGWTESVFSVPALESQYRQASGGDNGMDEQMVVQVAKAGIAGNKAAIITDALDLDVTDVALAQYVIDQFFSVCMAWSVPDAFIQSFRQGAIYGSLGIPDPGNGHFTPIASVRSGTVSGVDVTGFYELYTWGAWCLVSPAFVASVQPQCFCVFSPRQFHPGNGLDAKGRHITVQASKWRAAGGQEIPASVINAFPPVAPPQPAPPVPWIF